MASLGSLVIELAANTARLQGDLGKAVGMAERAASGFTRAFRGFAVGAGGLGLAAIANQAISLGDELQKGAQRAGVSAGEFSKLAAAAKQADVDISTLSRGLQQMQRTISEAASGSKTAVDSLDAIGLSVGTLRKLNPSQQLAAIADGLNRIVDPSDRARRGAEILGKSYLDLIPALQGGAAGLRALVAEQVKLGNTFSDEQIARLADADDAIKRLKSSWSGLATTLAIAVAPPLTEFFDRITSLVSGQGLDTLEERLRFLQNERNSFLPIVFEFGYTGEGGAVMGPGALDKRIAEIRRQIEETSAAARFGTGRGIRGGGGRGFGGKSLVSVQSEITDSVNTTTKAIKDQGLAWDEIYDQIGQGASEEANRHRQYFIEPVIEGWQDFQKQATASLNTVSTYADQAARNMQDAFADFLFDPFRDGLKGMLKGFIDIVRRMVAEAAAAKIFGSKKSGGLGLGDLITGAVGSLFGFAQGGSFNVGGSGGTDSQLVAFRATPGERVSVSTPAQQKSGRSIVVHQSVTVNAAQLTQDQAARMVADSQRMMWDELDRRYGLA